MVGRHLRTDCRKLVDRDVQRNPDFCCPVRWFNGIFQTGAQWLQSVSFQIEMDAFNQPGVVAYRWNSGEVGAISAASALEPHAG